MERNIALYDSDVFYATRFMEYFKKKKDFEFEILAFTRRESLEEYLEHHPIEILLLGDQAELPDLARDHIKYIYQLSESRGEDKDNGYPVINKYQKAQSVMAEIMTDYRKKENRNRTTPDPKQMKVISIFSPTQNAEALSLAWSIGSQLSEHRKVLLVLLELFPIQFISTDNNDNPSISEFIYYLKENPNVILKMNTLLNYSGNLSYLSGVTHGVDVLSMGIEEVHKWAEELRSHTDFQTVIFYLGCYTEAAVELMNISDTVIAGNADNGYEREIFMEWAGQMEKSGVNINQAKFIKLRLHGEPVLEHLPITQAELMQTTAWDFTKQYLNLL